MGSVPHIHPTKQKKRMKRIVFANKVRVFGLPRLLVLLFALFACTLQVAAQVKISGTVRNAGEGSPVVGATVFVAGTNAGTTTNKDGAFSLTVPDGNAVITVSFIGFKTREIKVGNRTYIDVELEEEVNKMDEVVVVGYGTMKRRDISGAVATVKTDDLLKANPSSVNQALQGRVAGLQVNQSDGAPGAGVSINIRGANSILTSTQPLYVVDGIPFDAGDTPVSAKANENNNQTANPLALLNPNDIESIEVLKDASATAIYGSRGANGVILITTKKGREGEAKVEFKSNFSFSTLGKKVDVLTPYEFAAFANEATRYTSIYDGAPFTGLPWAGVWKYSSTGKGTYNPKPEDFLKPGYYTDDKGNSTLVQGTDWQDQIYQNSFSQEYNLSVSGGTEKGYYAFSGNFIQQDGIIKNSGYKRYSVRANIGRNVKKWLELGMNTSFTRSSTDFVKTNSQDYSIIRSAMLYPATINVDDNTVDDQLNLMWLSANPRTYLNEATDNLVSSNVFSSAFANIRFTDYLSFRQNVGISYYNHDRGTYYSRLTGEGRGSDGRGGQSERWGVNSTFESILTFNKTFAKVHSLNIVAGFTVEDQQWGYKSMSATQFPTDLTKYYDLGAALSFDTPSTERQESMLISLLGRINYVFKDRYIVTASFRRDGSSRFAAGNKFANFYSGALAWRISEEPFIKNLNIFHNLKLRVSAGQTGNQGIPSYATVLELRTSNYPFGGTLNSGFDINTGKGAINPGLVWETTDQYDAGLDIGVLDGRINLTVDYYYKKTRDLLQNVKTPPSSGYDIKLQNSGYVTNEGLEISGQFYIKNKGDFRWDMNANISFNRNKIGGLKGDQFAQRLWSGFDNIFIQRNGCPIGAIYGYVEDGFYDNAAEVMADPANAGILNDPASVQRMIGEIKYRDLDGKAGITEADQTIIGDTNPDFIYGITSNFSYKNFTFSFFLQGVQGNDIFNGNLTNITMHSSANITRDAYNGRWTPETAATATWPRATTAQNRAMKVSNRYVEDGSYLRLKSIDLGYTFRFKSKSVSSLNIFASATNLFTITGYSWFDPDVNAFGGDATRRGVDLYSYPSSRTYSLGIKLVF